MKCPICKQELDGDAVFCAACGKKVPRCPTCGMVLYERVRFCENDGTPLPQELFAGFPPEQPAGPPAPETPVSAPGVPPPPKKKKGRGPLIAIIVAAVLLAAAGTAGYFIWKGEVPFFSEKEEKDAPVSSEEDGTQDAPEDDEDPSKAAPEPPEDREDAHRQEDAPPPEDGPLSETEAGAEQQIGQAGSIPAISMDAVLSVTASSYLTQSDYNLYHTPDRMTDGDLSTAWVEGASGDGIGEWVAFTFDGTYLVSGIQIYAGYQKSDALYEKNSRPAVLTVTFSDGGERTVTLEDVSGSQYIAFDDPVETSSVTLAIDSVYPGSKYQDTVISELSFY